jgi:hypothetical protein
MALSDYTPRVFALAPNLAQQPLFIVGVARKVPRMKLVDQAALDEVPYIPQQRAHASFSACKSGEYDSSPGVHAGNQYT